MKPRGLLLAPMRTWPAALIFNLFLSHWRLENARRRSKVRNARQQCERREHGAVRACPL
jgi:hypothetical protein